MIHLGIDFGTANTRVSKLENAPVPSVLKIGRGGYAPDMMPSTCWIDGEGRIEVGETSLARPDRLKFIKRYWQQRPEDQSEPIWPGGKKVISGRTYMCEEVVEAVLTEAITRAMENVSTSERQDGFTANIVCPVELDRDKRFALVQMLSRQGAVSVTLGNVIDEPLAAAVLYCRIEEHPPVKRDLLVFDAGAGTVDVAIVRYEEKNGVKRATVLAEAGRGMAGADLDKVMQDLLVKKIALQVPDVMINDVLRAYSNDLEAGRIAFEDECELMKIQLGRNPLATSVARSGFLGIERASFAITREEYCVGAKNILFALRDAASGALRMANTIIPDFDGVELAILVGGTSRLPFVREIVASVVPGAKVLSHDYLDEMLATVRGVGFSKDFADLVVLRPPYETRIRVTLKSGSTHTLILNEAFECFPRRQFFQTAVPIIQKREDYASPIDTVKVTFVSPVGKYIDVAEEDLDPALFRGCRELEAQLNIHASLCLRSGGSSRSLRAPYFTQVGLLPARPFNISNLNAPDVYPDDN